MSARARQLVHNDTSRLSWFPILLGLLTAIIIGGALFASTSIAALDFRGFYCAGEALRLHQDPYLTASLLSCEQHVGVGPHSMYDRTIVVPAPLPGYDLAVFAMLSFLPFLTAKIVWGAVLGASVFLACVALVRLTSFSGTTVLCALLPTLIAPSLAIGQMIPIYCAGAFACAAFVSRQNYAFAAVAATISLAEPHLAFPLVLSLLLWIARTRTIIICGGLLLAIVSIGVCGMHINSEYFRYVLPLQALAEVPEDGQLSLTVILHALNVRDSLATTIGMLSYVAVCGAAIWQSRLLARKWSENAVLVALPAAAAVVGGSYMHGGDIVASLPFALLGA